LTYRSAYTRHTKAVSDGTGVATTATEDPAPTQEGSEVNGFPEKVLLATDGLENTALAARAAVDLAKKGDAKKSISETRNYEAFAPWLSLSTSIVFLLIAV
jgi:serine/threonine protein phosphatase PrpC